MSIHVVWDNPAKTVIRYDFSGKWNWYGYEMAVGKAFGMAGERGKDVDYIFNLEHSNSFPDGAVLYLKRTLELSPSSNSLIIIAGGDESVEATIAMFSRIYKKLDNRLLMTATLNEARMMLTTVMRAAS
jgi:hypothetical protein